MHFILNSFGECDVLFQGSLRIAVFLKLDRCAFKARTAFITDKDSIDCDSTAAYRFCCSSVDGSGEFDDKFAIFDVIINERQSKR